MPAPSLSTLPSPPSRANPDTFSTRADAFMAALPSFVSQINSLVSYWNANIEPGSYIAPSGGTMTGALTMLNVPLNLDVASAAAGTIAIQFRVAGVAAGGMRIEPNGLANFPNGLKSAGSAVFTTAAPPTAAQVGALATTATATNSNALGGQALAAFARLAVLANFTAGLQVNGSAVFTVASPPTAAQVGALAVGGTAVNSNALGGQALSAFARLAISNVFTSAQTINTAGVNLVLGGAGNTPRIFFQNSSGDTLVDMNVILSGGNPVLSFNVGGKNFSINTASDGIFFDGRRILEVSALPDMTDGVSVGSTMFVQNAGTSTLSQGDTIAGTNLRNACISSAGTIAVGGSLAGTWKCLSRCTPGGATNFIRVA